MDELTLKLAKNLEELVESYGQRLGAIRDYAQFDESALRDIAREDLQLISGCLQQCDSSPFVKAVENRVGERLQQGFSLEGLLGALEQLEETLSGLVASVDSAKFLWGAFSQARSALSRAAAQALRMNEEIYETVFNTSPIMFWLKDTENRTLRINQAAANLEGVRPEDVAGKSCYDLYPREQADAFFEDDLTVIRSGKPKLGIVEQHTAVGSGELMWVETGKMPTRDADGNITGVLVFAIDITDRKRSEEQLHRISMALEQTAEGIAVSDLDGNLVFANRAWAEMHGYSVEEIQGVHLSVFHTIKQLREEVIPFNQQAMEVGFHRGEVGHVRKDGRVFPTMMSSTMLQDEADNTIGIVGSARDITEQKQAEQELLQEKAFSDSLINSLPGIFYLYDSQSRIVQWNKNLEELLGYSGEEMSQINALDTICEEDRELVASRMQDVFVSGQSSVEAHLITKHGRKVYHYLTGLRLMVGDEAYLVGVGYDISERKRLEQQVQEALERRGYQVQVSTQIAQEIAEAPALDELFRRVVALVKERFGFYHVQLLRYDPEADAVVLVSGYGETGQKMLEQGHRLPMGTGLVGAAAATGETVLRPELAGDPDWRPNPLLPETKGEIAVPIKLRDEVLGVLDVQSDQEGALSDDDRLLLEGLCGQIAIAIQNTRLLEEARIFRQFADAAGQALGIAELDGNITYANRVLARMLGAEAPEALYGHNVASYYPKDLVQKLQEEALPVVMAEGEWTGELWLSTPDGQLTPAIQNIFVIRDNEGNPLYLANVITDITERKQTEALMQERLDELNTLYRVTSREGWEAYRASGWASNAYLYDRLAVQPAEDLWLPKIREAVEQGRIVSAIPERTENEEQAAIAAPMSVRGEIIGALGVYDDPHNPLSEDELTLIEQVSDQVAQALEGARLFEQTQTALTEAQALYTGSARVIAASKTEEVLNTLVEVTPLRKLDRVYLYFFDQPWDVDVPETMIQVAGWQKGGGEPQEPLGTTYNLANHTILSRHLSAEEPLVIEDIRLDERVDENSRIVLDGLGTRGLLFLPLRAGGVWYGVLDGEYGQALHLSPDEIRQIRSLTDQSAIVMQSLQLQERMRERVRELTALQRMMSREAWVAYQAQAAVESRGYFFDRVNVKPLTAEAVPGGDGDGRRARAVAEATAALQDAFTAQLAVRGEPIGVLGVRQESGHSLTPEDQAFLQAISEQVAQAMERARLIEQTQRAAIELQAVADVSTAASTILNPEELLQSVVDLAKGNFGLYHAHAYLLDEASENLNLAVGAGEIGREMAAEGWSISLNEEKSLVAGVARTRAGHIIADVRQEEGHMANPLLPDTISELAVPMIVGDTLLGVFDVQSDVAERFSEEDVRVYSTLAAQVAVALQNAELYAEQLETVERLRELDNMKSAFLANMSHELRTPLNSILGFTQVIMEGLDGPLTDLMISDLELIEKNGNHLLNLINDVLDMAKIEAGRLTMSPEPLNLYELFDDVIVTNSPLARDKGLYMNLEADYEEDWTVMADHVRMRQILINLIGNSLKFTDSGGITIELEKLWARSEGESDRIQARIRDTGIGIPPERLEDIFEAFSQVDSTTTRKASGTGLGLPISRRLVELQGGRLWAESRGIPGEGSTLYLELPISGAPGLAPREVESA